jgi:hypothetical protein
VVAVVVVDVDEAAVADADVDVDPRRLSMNAGIISAAAGVLVGVAVAIGVAVLAVDDLLVTIDGGDSILRRWIDGMRCGGVVVVVAVVAIMDEDAMNAGVIRDAADRRFRK